MPVPSRQRSWWPLALLVILVATRIALDAWWLSEFRHGYPLNTDEVGYLTFALDNTQGLGSGGVAGPLWGLLAALIVMSIPEMTDWARTFHFAVPAAALFTAAIYALIRSEGLV